MEAASILRQPFFVISILCCCFFLSICFNSVAFPNDFLIFYC